jgi:multidrug efflux system outer membrane protein
MRAIWKARTVLAQAESDMAAATTQVDQDRNALNLLVGAPVDEALLPTTLAGLEAQIATPPVGLSPACCWPGPMWCRPNTR